MFNNLKQSILIGAIYGILLLVMAVIWFVLPVEITTKTALSFVFIWIPLTVMFGSMLYSCNRKRDEVMQNNLLTIIAALYLVAAVVISVILGILPVGIKAYVVIQLVILGAGIIAMICAYMAKNYIESN